MSIPKKEANMTTKIICHDVFELVYELHTDNTSTMFCRKRESDAPLCLYSGVSGLIAVAYKSAAYVHSPQTASALEIDLSMRMDPRSWYSSFACLMSSVFVFKSTTNCVWPVA